MEEKKKRLKLQCPYCEQLYDVTDMAPGTKILCAECDHTMLVPDKMTTRRISEGDLKRMRQREEERLKKQNLDVLQLDGADEDEAEAKKAEGAPATGDQEHRSPGHQPPQKKDTAREWIDWGTIRKGKKPEK